MQDRLSLDTKSPQTAAQSPHPVQSPREAAPSVHYEAMDKDVASPNNRRKAFIAVIALLVLGALIAIVVVLVRSNDEEDNTIPRMAGNLLMLPHVAVANLTMMSGTTDDDAMDACVQLGWYPTGVDWAASTGSTVYYLCMQQSMATEDSLGDVGAAALDDVSVLRRLVVVSNVENCPSTMQTISNPSSNVFVCAEYVSAITAFNTQQYVIDLMTTTESFYNHETPGWVTWPIDLKMESSTSSVYLSARYSVRPIVGLQVLTNATSDTVYSACNELQPQGQWEAPQFMLRSSASSSDFSDVVVCIQRPLANATGSFSVLTNVTIVQPSRSCPNAINGTEITSNSIKLCAEWGLVDFGTNSTNLISSEATSSFVAELSQYQTSEDEAADFSISTLPGDWDVVGDESTSNVHTFFLTRRFKPFALNSTVSSNMTNAASSRTNEVSSSIEAALSTSTEELTFRVLQIADMHITGDPDYRCSSSPDSFRDSILASASVIAEQLKKENNPTSSATAGEDNDPMYNECREALTLAFLDELIDIEQPDFVIFTGDNVHLYNDTTMHAFAIKAFTDRIESHKIPWAVVFGNHDGEGGLSHTEMFELMTEGKQYSYTKYGPRDIGGVGNYEVNIVAPTAGPWGPQGSTVFRMYFLDSHAFIDSTVYPSINDDSDYDWIKESQINFYRELAQSHMSENVNNVSVNGSVPATMYYHIPIPEYGLASPLTRKGEKHEATASAEVNSGLFSALVEVGDVKATFVGHDHINDYCYLRQGVQLCYGGGIGLGRAYGMVDFERRARVHEWTFHANKTRTLQSWMRFFADPTQIQSLEVLYSE